MIFFKQTPYLFIILFLVNLNLFSQANNTEAALYNIGVGSVFSGIGAVINKDSDEKFGEVLFKGMAQGALGGYLVYESKILVGKIAKQKKLEYGWPAKVVNSAGISIIENAASNRNFWEQWNLNIGFSRVEFHTKDKFKIRYKIMPVALLLTGYAAFGNKFESKMSLRTGEFIFSGTSYNNNTGLQLNGVAIGTSVILTPESSLNYSTVAHEIIHVYQYYDFNVVNAYFKKPLIEFEKGSSFFKILNGIFHYDISYFLKDGISRMEHFRVNTLTRKGYYQNFLEREAYYYSKY